MTRPTVQELLAQGWYFEYSAGTRFVAAKHERGGAFSVAEVYRSTRNDQDQVGEIIAAALNAVKTDDMDNLPVKTPSLPQPPDSLEELSNLLTEKIKESDCFDFDVSLKRLNSFKRIIVARELEWVNADGEEQCEYEGIVTIVIGKPGADFEKHERLR